MQPEDLIQILLDPQNAAFEDSWNALFMDVGKVRLLLGAIPKEKTQELLSAGQLWRGL